MTKLSEDKVEEMEEECSKKPEGIDILIMSVFIFISGVAFGYFWAWCALTR